MATALRARSTPYRPDLKAHERICTRCGIQFRTNPYKYSHTKCRDCR